MRFLVGQAKVGAAGQAEPDGGHVALERTRLAGADIEVLSSGKRGREDSGGLWREAEKQTNPGWVARSGTVQGPELGEHEGAAGKRKKKSHKR